jgi:hypothetical protein
MDSPKRPWWTGPEGSLLSEADGLALCVQKSSLTGNIRFFVLCCSDDATEPSRALAAGSEPSALRAMVAAEKSAAAVWQLLTAVWDVGPEPDDEGVLWPPWNAAQQPSLWVATSRPARSPSVLSMVE